MPSVKSIVLVSAQFAGMGGIMLTGPWLARHPAWLALQIAGCAVGAWSVLAMRLGNLHILPEFKADHQLVTRGPYRVIRHPMYTAVLMAFGALVADDFTWPRAGIWIALVVVHLLKLRFEEQILRAHFADYSDYARRTKRLLPFVW